MCVCKRGAARSNLSRARIRSTFPVKLTRRETRPAAPKRDARPGKTASNQEPGAPSVSVVPGGRKTCLLITPLLAALRPRRISGSEYAGSAERSSALSHSHQRTAMSG